MHTVVPSGLSGGSNLSKVKQPEPAACVSTAFWAGVSGRETKQGPVVRPPSALEFSTFTNQPAWEGAEPPAATKWGLCKHLPASWGEDRADPELSHMDGRGQATPSVGSSRGPFQPNTP